MKKLLAGLFALGVCAALAGCNRSEMPELEEGERWIVKEHSEEGDVGYIAKTLSELYQDSVFVAEVKITNTTTALNAGRGTLSTDAEFEVLHLYKGEYNGELFHIGGGYMKLSEYAEQVTWQDFSGYSKEEMENGYIYRSYYNTHIPEIEDTLLLFCNYSETEQVFYDASTNQSVYMCGENTITNDSMFYSEKYTDPLDWICRKTTVRHWSTTIIIPSA